MQLHNLLKNTPFEGSIDEAIEITGITDNSRAIQKGELFVAINGCETDGHQYIEQAIENGAVAVVGEKKINHLEIPYIRVQNSRLEIAQLACQFYGEPSKRKKVIGITGTNGKTTTAYMIQHLLQSYGYSCSLFGTIENVINGHTFKRPNTTLSAIELQKYFSESNDDYIVMEVSSHGIDQYRTAGIEFDCCLFTNLDQEHLDYHKTMASYFDVKTQLFQQLKPDGLAIVNTDDIWGQNLYDRLKKQSISVVKVGSGQQVDVQMSVENGSQLELSFQQSNTPKSNLKIVSPLPGVHNLYNVTLAVTALYHLGMNIEQLDTQFSTFTGVPGRFQLMEQAGRTVVVDYAHTPQAFRHLFETVQRLGAKRIIHVFGFRGQRDTLKRADMLQISKALSDVVLLTSDDLNGMSECEMVRAYKEVDVDAFIMMDRTLAIMHALDLAGEGDWVLITGKGHEVYKQEFYLPTSTDMETVQYLLGKSSKVEI